MAKQMLDKGVEAAPCAHLSCDSASQGGAYLYQLQFPCRMQRSTSAVVPVTVWQATGRRADAVFSAQDTAFLIIWSEVGFWGVAGGFCLSCLCVKVGNQVIWTPAAYLKE